MGWRLTRFLEFMFRTVMVPILELTSPIFFDRQYLTGRHFVKSGEGWRWVTRSLLTQRILRYNRHVPWPVSPFINISNPRNLKFDVDDLQNFQSMGCYFQNFAGMITIGRGTLIAPNCGFITANHDVADPTTHAPVADIVLGDGCWIGMN